MLSAADVVQDAAAAMSSQPLGELQGALDALGNVKLGKESSARGQAFDRVYGYAFASLRPIRN